jgi:serine acetyltransferase
VAAGAVVTRSITQENVIVGGIPAKIIAERPAAPKLNLNGLDTLDKMPVRREAVEAQTIS